MDEFKKSHSRRDYRRRKWSDAQVEPGGIAERAVKFQVISATLKLQEQTMAIGVCRLQTVPANRAARLAERSRNALSTLAERRRRLSRLGPHPARSRCSAGTGTSERLCRLSQPVHRDEVDWGWRRLAFGFGFFAFSPMLRGTRACRSARALRRGGSAGTGPMARAARKGSTALCVWQLA